MQTSVSYLVNLRGRLQQLKQPPGAALALFAGSVMACAGGIVCVLAAIGAGSALAGVGGVMLIGGAFGAAVKSVTLNIAAAQNLREAENCAPASLPGSISDDFDYAAAAASATPVQTMRPIRIRTRAPQQP